MTPTLLLIGLLLQGKEEITLAFKPQQGDQLILHEKKSIKITDSMEVEGFDQTRAFTVHFLEVKDGHPLRVSYEFTEDSRRESCSMQSIKKQGTFHRRKLTLGYEDGAPGIVDPPDFDPGKPEMNEFPWLERWSTLFPPKPVKVGEEWKTMVPAGASPMGEWKLRLVEIGMRLGKRCAVIGIAGESGMKDKAAKLKFSVKGSMIVWIDRGYILGLDFESRSVMKWSDAEDGLPAEIETTTWKHAFSAQPLK